MREERRLKFPLTPATLPPSGSHIQRSSLRGPVTGMVLAAGINTPARTWADQKMKEFAAILDTNLTSVARAIDLVLPGMRQVGQGNIVVVSSHAAWRYAPGAGVAYMTSKTALSSLVASVNDQEGINGIKACHLCPGEVDTEFLSLRPRVPDHAERSQMLTADDAVRAVSFVLNSPLHVRIDELAMSPIGQR
jgi:NADP-dependent 3-hydroxy acid dehydrogenase YdfG